MSELVKVSNVNGSQFKVVNGQPYVSSLYVAEVTGKEHKNVIADIRNIIAECELEFSQLNFQPSNYISDRGKNYPMYWLSEDGSSVLLGGYSISHRIKIQKELRELKDKQLQISKPDSYIIENPIERARRWIEEQEEKQLLLIKNTELTVEVDELKVKLELCDDYATIMVMENRYSTAFKWQPLRRYCKANGLEIKRVRDERFGNINTYPLEAWKSVYDIE